MLTLDLGFVIQGNEEDELPEQMMVGCRLHGIDPLTSPPLPSVSEQLMSNLEGESADGDSVTPEQ